MQQNGRKISSMFRRYLEQTKTLSSLTREVVNLYRSMLREDKSPRKLGGPADQPRVATIKWYDAGVGSRMVEPSFRGGFTGNGLSRKDSTRIQITGRLL